MFKLKNVITVIFLIFPLFFSFLVYEITPSKITYLIIILTLSIVYFLFLWSLLLWFPFLGKHSAKTFIVGFPTSFVLFIIGIGMT
ncbi:MAG: hypothetical protein L3J07_01395 [Candidatus Magasanikbacteria bacterium]|nr:hypothetical protein [Candidatus Magasanikbacteria bacterium]